MEIRCVANRVDLLPSAYLWPFPGAPIDRQLPIKVGSVYAVQAIETIRSGIWYYVEDEDYAHHRYPMWYPALCFEIVDESLSALWIVAQELQPHDGEVRLNLGFREWVSQPGFYALLLEADEAAQECYQARRPTLRQRD